MPRTRRTPAAPAAAEDATADATPPVTADASPVESAAAAGDAPKTRRRGTRTPKAEAQAEATDQGSPDDAAPPALARRRGRPRKAATDAGGTPPAPVSESAPPAGETGTPSADAPPHRRGRRTATPADAEPPANAQTPQTEARTEEPTAAEEAPAPAPRRRGRRSTTPTADVAAETPPPEMPETMTAGQETLTAEVPPPPRRRGRPRKADTAQAVPAAPPPEAAEGAGADVTSVGEALPRRRRGRGRGAALEAASAVPIEMPDVEAPVAETEGGEDAKTTGTAAGEDERRERKSRRSRRRRGGEEPTTESLEAAGAVLLVEETPVAEPVDEDEDDTLLDFAPSGVPLFVAPALVPLALPPATDAQLPRLAARVHRPARGLARIVAGEAEHLPYFFFVNAEAAPDAWAVAEQIRLAAGSGIHLFSSVMYLPLRNARGERSFAAADALLKQVLDADPDGFLLPRLQFVPTNFWARTHPDQMALDASGAEGDVSAASTEFWADCVDALDALIAHFADPATSGGNRVLGFHLDRGEWFSDAGAGHDLSSPNKTAFGHWLHAKYQQLYALRAAWQDGSVTFDEAPIPAWPGRTATVKKTDTPLYSTRREGRWPDYAQYSSELIADVIAGLARAVKTLSGGRMIVAVSYGYTLEFAGRGDSGHLALGRLLESPDIDIVAGPPSYAGRAAGGTSAFGAPLDSVALHGKLWLVEDDTKTFLADGETDDDYNPKIVGGADTQAVHQRHFGAALAHGAGVTWMDLWGRGWLRSPDVWDALGDLTRQAARWERLIPTPPPAPDVAVLVDEASLRFLRNDPDGLGAHLVGQTRDLLLKAGGSVGFYLQSDLVRDDFPDARLFLFLDALRLTTGERQAIREKLQKPGKTLAWLYAPGLFDENGPSAEEAGDVVGIALRAQPWNSRGGSTVVEARYPLAERLRGQKQIGKDEIVNPLYAAADPQATVVAEYTASGAASLATREHKAGWKSVFFGDPSLTLELLRGLYAYANVPVYEAGDDVVHAGADGSLTVHGTTTGQRTVTLPRRASVYDVFDDKIVATNALSFRPFVRARATRLYLWGDGSALAQSTGLDLPAPTAEAESVPTQAPPQTLMQEPPAVAPAAREVTPRVGVIPGLDPAPPDDVLDALDAQDGGPSDEIDAGDEPPEGDGAEAPARRSRWQRRRAALRARRDAERAAKFAGDTPGGQDAGDPSVEFAALMPGLPPRRAPITSQPPVTTLIVPADRVAEIVAADTADDAPFSPSDAQALTLSDAALADMADGYGAAQAEAEGK